MGKPTKTSRQILHHKCAIKARMCWSLWNQGFPMAEVLDHRPDASDYVTTLNVPENGVFYQGPSGKNDHGRIHQITPTELATFLIDLLRLEKMNLHGHFGLALIDYETSFERLKHHGKRIVLTPVFSDMQDDTTKPTDMVKLSKIAAKYAMPDQATSIVRCKNIESILAGVNGLVLRKDKDTVGPAELVINLDEQPHTMFVKHGANTFAITPNQHGFWMYSKPIERNGRPGVVVPITLAPFPDPSMGNPWIERGLCWQSIPQIWNQGRNEKVIRNTIGTLAAEFQHAENSCYHYKVEEHDLNDGTASLRIERRDKNANAHDLWEHAVRNREMNIAVNTDPSVFNWKQNEEWNLDAIHDKDPFLLTVRSTNNSSKLPKAGYLKIASVPQRALMLRKEKLVRTGIQMQAIRNLFQTKKDAVSKNLPLSKRGPIVALQGPPGTGKTYTASQMVKGLLSENPCARILVSSKEHLALDHLANEIRNALDPAFDVVRISNAEFDSDREIDDEVLPNTITHRILDEVDLPEESMLEVGKVATWVEELALRASSVVCTTTLDRAMEHLQQSGVIFDYAVVEEAGKSYPSELIGPISIARRTLLIGDHLQLPPFELDAIQKSVQQCLQQGITNWSERGFRDSIDRLLIENTVGFNKRDELNIEYTSLEIEKWLQPFQHLHVHTDGDSLSSQWRMFQSLSDTIGEIFYGAPFVVKKKNAINENELPGIFGKHKERLLFMDVDDAVEGKRNKSFSNSKEAKLTADCLTKLLKSGADAVAITPYKGQLAEIRNHLPEEHHKSVRTVDGFQGKEADFIVLSLVRNNKRTGSARRWGFFRDPRRINVALSRSREGILVISSLNHIKNTDWAANEGQLARFVESVERKGKIIQEEGK